MFRLWGFRRVFGSRVAEFFVVARILCFLLEGLCGFHDEGLRNVELQDFCGFWPEVEALSRFRF